MKVSEANTPEQTAALLAALAQAVLSVDSVAKDGTNRHHRYAYASAEAILAAGREALAAEGLSLIAGGQTYRPSKEDEQFFDPSVSDMVRMNLILVRSFVLTHRDGGTIDLGSTEWPIVVEKGRPEDKATAGALTAMIAYRLRDLLLLPRVEGGTGLDDEREHTPRNKQGQRTDPGIDNERILSHLLMASQRLTEPKDFRELVERGRMKLSPGMQHALEAYCAALILIRRHGSTFTGPESGGLTTAQEEHLVKARDVLRRYKLADYFNDDDGDDAAAVPS